MTTFTVRVLDEFGHQIDEVGEYRTSTVAELNYRDIKRSLCRGGSSVQLVEHDEGESRVSMEFIR